MDDYNDSPASDGLHLRADGMTWRSNMQWYFEPKDGLHYIEIEEPEITGNVANYDYYFADSLLHAADANWGSKLWMRQDGNNYLVWELDSRPFRMLVDESEHGDASGPRLTQTVEYHEMVMKLLAVVRPFWEAVAGVRPELEQAIATKTGWIAGKVSDEELERRSKECSDVADAYPEGLLRAYPHTVARFCLADRSELIHDAVAKWLVLVGINSSDWLEKTWAELFVERLENQEPRTEDQEVSLRCLKQILASPPTTTACRQVIGFWFVGDSEPQGEQQSSILEALRKDQPRLFFASCGEIAEVCDIERLVHALRLRELEMVLEAWPTAWEYRQNVVATLSVFEQWIDGAVDDETLESAVALVQVHLSQNSESDLTHGDKSADKVMEANIAKLITMAVSELGPSLHTYSFLNHMLLHDLHAHVLGEKTSEMTEDLAINTCHTTMDRVLTPWIAGAIRDRIEARGEVSSVTLAALRQLNAESSESQC